MHIEEQGLKSLCTEGRLGQDTMATLNLLLSFVFFASTLFIFFTL